MSDIINFNGKFLHANEPVIHSDNRSFQYGDGLFETIRYSNGNLMFFDDHYERLKRGIKFLGLQLPEYFDLHFLKRQIVETAESNDISLNARVKVTLFRSGAGKYEPETNAPEFLIKTTPLYRPDYQWNENGLHLGLFEKMQKPCDELSNFKTTSSLLYVLAAIHKKESGFDESIILNVKGNVADAIYANVFIVKEMKIYTPSLSEAGVDGVMRKQVLRIANKNGYKTSEKSINLRDLLEADEIFLTNAIKGIVWVNRFSGKTYSNAVSSELMNKLNELIG